MKRKSNLERLNKAVSKKYGTSPITMGIKTLKMNRLKTGSLSLDIALGGGIPVGRVTMMYGQRSSGKTTTAYRIAGLAQGLCANCLRQVNTKIEENLDKETGEYIAERVGFCDCYQKGLINPKSFPDENASEYKARLEGYGKNSYEAFQVALIDLEGSFDFNWAESLGLDSRTIVYVRPDTAEEAIDLYDSLVRTGSIDLFILDSIAAMTPSKEVEESVEKWQQGLQARLVNKFCRKVQSSSNAMARDYGRSPTQIWINQLRMKIGVMFGNPETVPGGMGQEFATSVQIKLWASEYEKDKSELNSDWDIANSVRINFKTEKNKTAPPKRSGSYVMNLSNGEIDDNKLLYQLGESLGHITRDGNKWLLGGKEFSTKKALISELISSDLEKQVILSLAQKSLEK